MIEDALFDAMHQLFRLAAGRDEVEPAPRGMGLLGNADDAASQHVEAAKIVEQPAIDAIFPDRRLHRRQIKHRKPRLNNCCGGCG